jgi:anti-sigma regulatory factor (Ser/Thr protein kinase)
VNSPSHRSADEAAGARFRHEAVLYAGPRQFVERTVGFVHDALESGEPVLVAVIEPRAGLLRDALGADARRVEFLDMERVGRNPARIIPAWQDWVDRNVPAGRRFRGIGEPVWKGRTRAEIAECEWHETLLNTAFDEGPAWWLICPYDTESLDPDVIARADGTHPGVLDGPDLVDDAARRSSAIYPDARCGTESVLRAPLEEPCAAAVVFEVSFGAADLSRLRVAFGRVCAAEGLTGDRADGFVLAAHELACNSVMHGGGSGTLRLWRRDAGLVCEVRDAGVITDPLVGRRRPGAAVEGGAGLWIANRACDLLRIRSAPETGTTVRMEIDLSGDW